MTAAFLRVLACAAGALALAACGSDSHVTVSGKAPEAASTYFSSPEAAVTEANRLLAARDFAALARCYDLSRSPQVRREDLASGRFFVDQSASATGPAAVTRWREPFAPGSKFVDAERVGDSPGLPRTWSVTTLLTIDQGDGTEPQRVTRTCRMLQTQDGYRFLPPEPKTDATGSGPSSNASPSADTDADTGWWSRGADAVLFYRPSLRDRAESDVPRGGASQLTALATAVARLKPIAAASPGASRKGGKPWEPADVYEPTDDELLLSLAGDRIARSAQLAPEGTLFAARHLHPDLPESIEYAHIEITRIDVAGTGPCYVAAPPVVRKVGLVEAPR